MALELVGRERELQAAADFFTRLVSGPASLVFAGEAGIGKTTLWEAALSGARERDYRVLTARPAEPDRSLSFAGLADLLAEVSSDRFGQLPAPQRIALDAALLRGDNTGRTPDARAVFTAVRSVVTGMCDRKPVVVAIDDVQWLDPPSLHALQFVSRRLGRRNIGLLLSLRIEDGDADRLLAGFGLEANRIDLGPLTLAATHQMLKQRLRRLFARPTLLKIHQASGGNPFFVLEIARTLGSRDLRPGEPLPVPLDVRALVRRRIEGLPKPTRRILLFAAALSQPTASQLGGGLESAWETGLIRELPDGTIDFTHPLYASAVYEAASPDERRRVHRDLAERVTDVEERARHLALAATAPDEQLALELDRAAARASSRGAPEMAAELQEQARAFTPSERSKAARERGIRAAELYIHAGDRPRARALLEGLLRQTQSGPDRSDALRLLAEIHHNEDGFADAARLLEEALVYAEGAAIRARIHLSLVFSHCRVGDFIHADAHADRALDEAVRSGDNALLGEALAMRAMTDYLIGRGIDWQIVERSLALEDKERGLPVHMRPSMIAALLTLYVGRLAEAREQLTALRRAAIDSGDESDLAFVLLWLAHLETLNGRFVEAEALTDEAAVQAALTGSEASRAWALAQRAHVSAHRGRAAEARADAAEAAASCERFGFWHPMLWVSSALGLLELSVGDPAGAWQAVQPMTELVEAEGIGEPDPHRFLPTALEALAALGELDRAERLLDAFERQARELDRVWALATGARCRGLLLAARGELDGALEAIDQALVEHERVAMPFERARTMLAKGQIERRARRKLHAKRSLDEALSAFERLGAELWADKARAELARVALKRAAPDELTEAERRVAGLAGSGLTNREIAMQLFISPKTVEAHLGRVYRKLDVRSKAELAAMLAASTQVVTDLLNQM